MKAELEVAKRGRKCSYCGVKIEKDVKFIESTDWHPGIKFPIKKNICFDCLKVRTEEIRTLELLLADLRVLQRAVKNII